MEKINEGIYLYSVILNLFDQSDLNNPDDACRKAIDKFYIVRRMKKERKLYFYGFFEENKYAVILVPFLVYYGSSFIMKYLFGSTASLMTTSGMMLLYKDIAVYVAVQIFIVFVVDLLFFMKIKKDVI